MNTSRNWFQKIISSQIKPYNGIKDGLGRKYKGQQDSVSYIRRCPHCNSTNNINSYKCHNKSCGALLSNIPPISIMQAKDPKSKVNQQAKINREKKKNTEQVAINGVVHERQKNIQQQNIRAITSSVIIAKKQKNYISDTFSFMQNEEDLNVENKDMKYMSCEDSQHGDYIDESFHNLCG